MLSGQRSPLRISCPASPPLSPSRRPHPRPRTILHARQPPSHAGQCSRLPCDPHPPGGRPPSPARANCLPNTAPHLPSHALSVCAARSHCPSSVRAAACRRLLPTRTPHSAVTLPSLPRDGVRVRCRVSHGAPRVRSRDPFNDNDQRGRGRLAIPPLSAGLSRGRERAGQCGPPFD